MTPLEFLELLWLSKPPDMYVLIWTRQNKNSWWYKDIRDAARYVEKAKRIRDVYTGVGLSHKDWGFHRRCPSSEIKGLCGLWADIDIHSKAHSNGQLPTSVDSIYYMMSENSIPDPTLVVHTGNGVHLWWLFKEPWVFDDTSYPASVALCWNTMIRDAMYRKGWTFERLADLSRVLRVPDTFNFKSCGDPTPVTVAKFTGIRYEVSDLAKISEKCEPPTPAGTIDPSRLAVSVVTRELLERCMMDPTFEDIWMKKKVLRDSSQSGYDMAIAVWGVRNGLDPGQIASLIAAHRNLHGERPRLYKEYYVRTIARAMAWNSNNHRKFPNTIPQCG